MHCLRDSQRRGFKKHTAQGCENEALLQAAVCAYKPIRWCGAIVESDIFSMTCSTRRAPTVQLKQGRNKRGECDELSRLLRSIADDGARMRPLDYWIIRADLRNSFVAQAVSEQWLVAIARHVTCSRHT